MDFTNRNKLLLDLQRIEFLPSFNAELYNGITINHQQNLQRVQEAFKKQRDNPELKDKIRPYIALQLKDMERSKRVQIAYLMHRVNKIQEYHWMNGQLQNEQYQYMSDQEKEYYKQFEGFIKSYEREVDISVSQNISPPSEVYVEVRVMKQIGKIVTPEGEELDLQAGTQLLVKKSDVHRFLKDGSLIQI